MEKSGVKIAAQNRKAYHDYFVEDRYEAGIELFGTEVKSIRAGTLNLKDSFCVAKDGDAVLCVQKKARGYPNRIAPCCAYACIAAITYALRYTRPLRRRCEYSLFPHREFPH